MKKFSKSYFSLLKDTITFFTLSGLECGSIKDLTSKEEVVKALKTPLASMQYGTEDFLAELVAQACSKLSFSSHHTHAHTYSHTYMHSHTEAILLVVNLRSSLAYFICPTPFP